jgi:regulatory protein
MRRRTEKQADDPRDEQAARERCLRLLTQRSRSAAELRERLSSAGYDEYVIAGAISGLEGAGLVNDEEFARSWVTSRKAAGRAGRRRLAWELGRKGVDRGLIERVLAEELEAEVETEQAMELARRRLRGRQSTERDERSRLRRYLLGRGFGFEAVDSVMERVIRESED